MRSRRPEKPRPRRTGLDPRRRPGSTLAAAVSALALLLAAGACQRQEEPLHLVVVLSDALRAPSLPFHGYPRDTAPHLAELAAESVVFERHLANYPATPTSVSQMLSGRLMAPLLMDHSYALAPVRAVEEDLLILPAALREAGYRTALVSAHPWFNKRARVLRHFEHQAVVDPAPGEAYAPFADLAGPTRQALDRLASGREPFFLYLHAMDTHGPFRRHEGFPAFDAGGEYPEVYDLYDSEILYTDHWVGWLIRELRDRGLLERTVFVFTSDHGEELGERGAEFWNRSHGYTLRRVQLHVPLLLRFPGGTHGGTRIREMTNHLDVAPTLLRLLDPGAELDRYRIDGRDLSGRILNGWVDEGDGVSTAAFTWRYWGLHRGDLELHYDQWRDEHTLYRVEASRFNYPWSSAVQAPEAEAALRQELERTRRVQSRESLRLPRSHEALGRIAIGVPTHVVDAAPGSPTFDPSPRDDRWFQDTVLRLEAAPGERPGPITLSTPWAPGVYRVRVRLSPGGLRQGFENRFRIRIGGAAGEPVELDHRSATEPALLDAGLHRIGSLFQVEISRPRGGVSLAGFVLELQGAEADGEPLDPDLEERLRALGYVD